MDRSPRRDDAAKVERAVALRRKQRLGHQCIAERVCLSKSAVGRACKAASVARLLAFEPGAPAKRYERSSADEWLHIDTKKLARFAQQGHRVTGDRTQ